MFRDCCQRNGKGLGQITDRCFALGQPIEDGATSGIAKRMKDKIEIMLNQLVDYNRFRSIVNPLVEYFRSLNSEGSTRFPGMAK